MNGVVFAPDWRAGVPYQELLAAALEKCGVRVSFFSGYKRLFPLARLAKRFPGQILHLHWPEAFYPKRGDLFDFFRNARFALDLRAASRRNCIATTGHNLYPHDRSSEWFAHRNMAAAHRAASIVFAHSDAAKAKLISSFHLSPTKVRVVPHGDLSVTLGAPCERAAARQGLDIASHARIALLFGTIEPYKGQEELITWWRERNPDVTLVIAGKPESSEYEDKIRKMIGGGPNILLRAGWLSDEQLRQWLSAADVALFNYRTILTSGAASLARSWGLPVILPHRLDTVALDEPSPFVHRFHEMDRDFQDCLTAAMLQPADYPAARGFRENCNWDRIAGLTVDGYRDALSLRARPASH